MLKAEEKDPLHWGLHVQGSGWSKSSPRFLAKLCVLQMRQLLNHTKEQASGGPPTHLYRGKGWGPSAWVESDSPRKAIFSDGDPLVAVGPVPNS